ncbi:predicted protein [Sclerotinia sclerotiorum 1980 UF-70]|uniref:Uncharacterized protein n=1 Tax=Sclerotinia sclerotiorum (strain ATCC 18683 / 1980 / Ss-1) TaxID=665079 RepID=A7F3Q9_SCLS1|nr:predicted protein [Sclerotinia sclerotiorum 1980 UF-70]EDN97380.1 predicted protein [Sclerotinia sclerotiorum 1980 UF-70]
MYPLHRRSIVFRPDYRYAIIPKDVQTRPQATHPIELHFYRLDEKKDHDKRLAHVHPPTPPPNKLKAHKITAQENLDDCSGGWSRGASQCKGSRVTGEAAWGSTEAEEDRLVKRVERVFNRKLGLEDEEYDD